MPTKSYNPDYVLTGNAFVHLVPTAGMPADPKTEWSLIDHPDYGHKTLHASYSAILAGFTNGDTGFKRMRKENEFDSNEFDDPFLSVVERSSGQCTLGSRSRLLPIWSQLQRGVAYVREDSTTVSGGKVDFEYSSPEVQPVEYGVVLVAPNRGNVHVAWIPRVRIEGEFEDKLKKGGLTEQAITLKGVFDSRAPYSWSKYTIWAADPDA